MAQKVKKDFFLMSTYYYFWQLVLPVDNTPVRGSNYGDPSWIEFLHLFFIALLLVIFRKDVIFFYLIIAHALLIPFIGLVPAPFMMVTWVSDQHLYAVLPVFYMMWVAIMEKIKMKYLWIIPGIYLAFLSYQTYESSKYYRNEFAFYEQSLKYNPTNFAVAYNLAFAHLKVGKYNEALAVLESTHNIAEDMPELKDRKFFDSLMNLYFVLKFPIDLEAKK
jgi:tetratricopeptide (TPR) repeat protein